MSDILELFIEDLGTVTGGVRVPKAPGSGLTTLAVGEEGGTDRGGVTTAAVGEEGGAPSQGPSIVPLSSSK